MAQLALQSDCRWTVWAYRFATLDVSAVSPVPFWVRSHSFSALEPSCEALQDTANETKSYGHQIRLEPADPCGYLPCGADARCRSADRGAGRSSRAGDYGPANPGPYSISGRRSLGRSGAWLAGG